MGQKFSQNELALHRGNYLGRNVYNWFDTSSGVTAERKVVCDVTIEARGTYRGITLYGWMIGGGHNTANVQHIYTDFVLQIDFAATPSYRGWQDNTITTAKLQIWEHDTDDLTWRICMNYTTASQSVSMEFRELPLAYWETINRGINMHNPRTVADMTGYTQRFQLG
jgi:hypothetical protein